MAEGWEEQEDGSWRRAVDGVQVTRTSVGWKVTNASGRDVLGAGGESRTWANADTAQRQCDFGALQPDVLPVQEDADPAGLRALIDAIRHLHGLEATWLESVEVKETHEGQTVWEGEVQVFEVTHPKASRVYAWSHESGREGRRRFHAVLGAPPVTGPREAVRVAIVDEVNRAKN